MSIYAVSNPSISYNLYGYNLLSQIYDNISKTVNRNPSYYDLNKHPRLKEKIEKLEKLEKDIYDSLKNEALREELRVASKGYINVDIIPDEALPGILEKHSNLLGLTNKYNSKVTKLVDQLQSINNELIGKVNIAGQDYGVKMSVKYPVFY